MPQGEAYEKRKERRFYATVPGRDPHDGGDWDLLISPEAMEWHKRGGTGKALELAHTVRWALTYPYAIFKGVRDWDREISEDDWLCYAANPSFAYDFKTAERVKAWDGEVFLVYVNEERVYFQSYWCECDAVKQEAASVARTAIS